MDLVAGGRLTAAVSGAGGFGILGGGYGRDEGDGVGFITWSMASGPRIREAVAKGADIIVAQGAEGGDHGVSCATLPLGAEGLHLAHASTPQKKRSATPCWHHAGAGGHRQGWAGAGGNDEIDCPLD